MTIIDNIPHAHFVNQTVYRLIPSKYPPISLFDDVATHDEFEVLFSIQELTNPRLRNELGSLNRVPVSDRPYGIRGCNYALGPFVHVNPAGSRFSRGEFGVFYAGDDVQTAIAETRYHQEKYFSGVEGLKYDLLSMRCLKTQFSASLRDIRGAEFFDKNWHSPDDYTSAQMLGDLVKANSEAGLVYNSVRAPNKTCYGLFNPRIINDIVQTSHYDYIWDGEKIIVTLETSQVL